MKISNIKNVDKFFEIINSCEGKVELVTGEGDRLNLKSQLTKYVALAKLFSDGNIVPEVELVVYSRNDVDKFIDYMMNQ